MDKIFSPIKERITKYIIDQSIKKTDFYKITEITASNFKGSGAKSEIGGEKIAKILTCYPNLSPDWLLTGQGSMLRNKQTTSLQENQSHTDYRLVPLYNFDAVGGSSCEVTDSVTYIEEYVPFLEAKSDDICMHVTGRSMFPTYAAGTVVLLHPVYQWKEFLEYGEVYVIDLKDDRRLIKEIRRSIESPLNNFLLHSHNPDYDSVEIPKTLINRVWIVKAIYQKTTM